MYHNTMEHPYFLEDYIITLDTLSRSNNQDSIQLGNRDKLAVRQFTQQLKYNNIGLTEDQSKFVKILILKYKNQLKKFNVEVPVDLDSVEYKLPIRVIIKNKELYSKDGYLHIISSYDSEFISLMTELSEKHTGIFKYNSSSHWWTCPDIDYYRYLMIDHLYKYENLILSPELKTFYDTVKSYDLTEYKIELKMDGTVQNAHYTLVDVLNKKTEGLDGDKKLLELFDLAPIYKYDTSIEVQEYLYNKFSIDQEVKDLIKSSSFVTSNLDTIVSYVTLTNKKTILIEGDLDSSFLILDNLKPIGYRKIDLAKSDISDTSNSLVKILLSLSNSDNLDIDLNIVIGIQVYSYGFDCNTKRILYDIR